MAPALALLMGVGVCATIGQVFLTKAFAAGPPAKVSVVALTQVAFGMGLDLLDESYTFSLLRPIGVVLVTRANGLADPHTRSTTDRRPLILATRILRYWNAAVTLHSFAPGASKRPRSARRSKDLPTVNSLQAHLLIGSPELAEPFGHSVILMVRHNEDGALGLILNRRLTTLLKENWSKLSTCPAIVTSRSSWADPAKDRSWPCTLTNSCPRWKSCPDCISCAGKDKLERLAAQQGGPPIKFFAGYSGWSPGQLESELARGSLVGDASQAEHVFAHEDEAVGPYADSGRCSPAAIAHQGAPPGPPLN